MTDVLPLIDSALTAFTATVVAVPDDAWDNPTPCDEWTVRDLVNHVTSEHLWAPRLLEGETIEEVGDVYDGDVLGADPVAAWRAAAQRSAAAWAAADLTRPVHLSFGTVPTSDYAEQILSDLAVHRWDLQRGATVGDGLDGPVVEHVLAHVREHVDDYSGSGVFKAPVETDSEYAHDQLLALLGRSPYWKQPTTAD